MTKGLRMIYALLLVLVINALMTLSTPTTGSSENPTFKPTKKSSHSAPQPSMSRLRPNLKPAVKLSAKPSVTHPFASVEEVLRPSSKISPKPSLSPPVKPTFKPTLEPSKVKRSKRPKAY